MALNGPFVRWFLEKHANHVSPNGAFYYLETRFGHREKVASSTSRGTNHLIYKAIPSFLENYANILPLGNHIQWRRARDLEKWLDSIVYHSFQLHTTGGVQRCWFIKKITQLNLTASTTIPAGFRPFFNGENRNIWIMLKHRSKLWPVLVIDNKFCEGWSDFKQDLDLEVNDRIILGFERRWLFNVLIFNNNDVEIRYGYLAPPQDWQYLHIPPDGLLTTCLPRTMEHQLTLQKFGYLHLPGTNLLAKFESHLEHVLGATQQQNLKIFHRFWIVPIHGLQLNAIAFNAFVAALHLNVLDYVLVAKSPTLEIQAVIFDDESGKRIYA